MGWCDPSGPVLHWENVATINKFGTFSDYFYTNVTIYNNAYSCAYRTIESQCPALKHIAWNVVTTTQ